MIFAIGIGLLILSYLVNAFNFAFHKVYNDDDDFLNIVILIASIIMNVLGIMLLVNAYE